MYFTGVKGDGRLKFYMAGEFAKLIGISSVTLRKWDKKGWLKPHHRSPSGYRYYSEVQLSDYLNNGLSVGYPLSGYLDDLL